MGNELTKEPLGNIQLQIKRMLAMIAEQNLCNETPLASSKKIKLQNCLALSHCDKDIDHKEFDTEQFGQVFSGKTTSSVYTCKTEPKEPKVSQVEPKQELEVKKIMYMLDGKNKHLEIAANKD
jgi:hypothetical protein